MRQTIASLAVLCLLAFSNVSRSDLDATGATSASKPEPQANRPAAKKAAQDWLLVDFGTAVVLVQDAPIARGHRGKRPANIPTARNHAGVSDETIRLRMRVLELLK